MSSFVPQHQEIIDLLSSDSELGDEDEEEPLLEKEAVINDDDEVLFNNITKQAGKKVDSAGEDFLILGGSCSLSPETFKEDSSNMEHDVAAARTALSKSPRPSSVHRRRTPPKLRTVNDEMAINEDNFSVDVWNPEQDTSDHDDDETDKAFYHERKQSATTNDPGEKVPVRTIRVNTKIKPTKLPGTAASKENDNQGQNEKKKRDSSTGLEADVENVSSNPASHQSDKDRPASAAAPPAVPFKALLFTPEAMERVITDEIDAAQKAILKKSPYTDDFNAELNEPIFEKIKEYISPYTDENTNKTDVNPELIRLFGETLARSIFLFRQSIHTMTTECFAPRWADNSEQIPGLTGCWVPKRQVLFCLYDDRFVDAPRHTLQRVITELECAKAVRKLISRFKLKEYYPYLVVSNTYTYLKNSRERDCMKAEIFCARAYAALLSVRNCSMINYSLERKIFACLAIMHQNINKSKSAQSKVEKLLEELNERKKKKEQEQLRKSNSRAPPSRSNAKPSISPLELDRSSSPEQGPVREISVVAIRKNSPEEESEASAVTMNIPTTCGGDTRRNVANNTSIGSRGHSSIRKTIKTHEERVQSLMTLYGIVEEQHNRLGQTIGLLQDSIKEHQDLCRAEMREELRAEMKRELEQQDALDKSRKKTRRS
jgi:hypothetical protein